MFLEIHGFLTNFCLWIISMDFDGLWSIFGLFLFSFVDLVHSVNFFDFFDFFDNFGLNGGRGLSSAQALLKKLQFYLIKSQILHYRVNCSEATTSIQTKVCMAQYTSLEPLIMMRNEVITSRQPLQPHFCKT